MCFLDVIKSRWQHEILTDRQESFFYVRQILQSISVMNSSSLDQQKRSFLLNNKFDEAIPNLFFTFWASSRNNLFRILKIVQSCFHTNLAPNQRPTIIRFLSPNAIVYVALKKDGKLNFIEIFFVHRWCFNCFWLFLHLNIVISFFHQFSQGCYDWQSGLKTPDKHQVDIFFT